MDCADEAKDMIPADAKEGDAVVERAMAQVRMARLACLFISGTIEQLMLTQPVFCFTTQ